MSNMFCALLETDRLERLKTWGLEDYFPFVMTLHRVSCYLQGGVLLHHTALLVLILSFCYETRSRSCHFEILKGSPTSPVG